MVSHLFRFTQQKILDYAEFGKGKHIIFSMNNYAFIKYLEILFSNFKCARKKENACTLPRKITKKIVNESVVFQLPVPIIKNSLRARFLNQSNRTTHGGISAISMDHVAIIQIAQQQTFLLYLFTMRPLLST